ncbi:hypothetical protein [Sphingomonas bacterium]|uniref:hypothetical protein n=1 Tax=Sphingomonas bacterium TaxID=1895847 RepID=UPI001576E1CC|nr:hypothetical protein [Sphingomonas bacterium]
MTSIGNTFPGFQMPPSPRARIDARIAAAASAGTISQTDGTALETAVDAIGQSLRSGGSILAGAGGSAAPTSGTGTSFKDKLDGLIDAQVTGGTLTDAQATELKGIFGQGAPSQGVQGQGADADQDGGQVTATTGTTGQTPAAGGAVHGHHHHGGGGGGMAAIMAALDGSDSTDGSTDTSAIDALTGTTSTGATASTTSSATSPIAATTAASSTTAVSATDTATPQLDKLIGFLEKMRESIGSAQTYGTGSADSSGTDAAGMVFSGIA